jgi:myosin V
MVEILMKWDAFADTYTGKICIAVNPYQWLNLYDKSIMAGFSDGTREGKAPHVYAVSMEAFTSMRSKGQNQSILVSGESGAGKTETTKIVMSHLATLAENSNSKVIQQIIQANPLLESFGNAQTVRNDNSSRFGKFTELQFGGDGKLVGAFSRTYLLEKSRVTTQAPGERNFHIFYQLLKKREQYPELELAAFDSFHYVSGSSRQDNSPVMPEEGDLTRTKEALELVGIGSDLQTEILRILAGVLHLGETQFSVRNGDVDASQIVDMKPFETVCRLLGVEVAALERAICNRNVHVGREVFLKPMTRDQAIDCRDALAKSLYSKLFLWLVEQINDTIGASAKNASSFIGILDIFGFEHFEKNSFEQFCINYANEKLQQKFVQDVLKTVQIEYEEENISWSHIQFADNQDVLNLIEGRLGVISFLNEESLLATGTDAAFASKLGAVMENNPLLEIPRLNKCAFTIYHYAGKVTYDASGFLDKHRDAILPDIKQCMSTSMLTILSKTFEADATPISASTGIPRIASRKKMQAQPKRSTVGSQFKESLGQLMEKIHLTEVHYVRCLKPNPTKSANAFAHGEIVNQLRCAGVIEAIRVSRSAYPSRLPHVEFLKKFGMLAVAASDAGKSPPSLLDSDSDSDLVRAQCEDVLAKLMPGRNIQDYQTGLTRVYFREGVLENLEAMRAQALRKYALILQKNARCFVQRRRFLRLKKSCIVVQQYWRRYVARKKYLTMRRGIVKLQARARGYHARKQFRTMKFDHYIIRFQAICRAFIQRRRYKEKIAAARKIQGFFRFTLLRLVFLKRMEKEKHVKALGSKVARLQMKLDQKHTATKASPSGVAAKARTGSVLGETAQGSGSAANGRNSMQFNPRNSATSSVGILDESQEVITALHDENERLRQQLDDQEDEMQKLKAEIRTLRQWQKSKEVDEKVQKIAHRDQESKDLSFLYALETEYEKLRVFVCENMGLPSDTGTITTPQVGAPTPPAANGAPVSAAPSGRPAAPTPPTERSLAATAAAAAAQSGQPEQKVIDAQQVLLKSATRLANARSKTSTKGSARRVKDHWEEIRNYPPPMHYSLGSVPWKRLLTDWAQGNPKKLDYMTRWLKNVLDGGPIVSDTFPMGVELKYVTPMMLDGFMQLVIPKLAERPDVQVHVHTKEFIGTSMRITLSPLEGAKAGRGGGSSVHLRAGEHDDYRVSILANQSPLTSRYSSSGSTASMDSSSSSAPSVSSVHRPSGGFFRSSRSSNHGESGRSSFFQRK